MYMNIFLCDDDPVYLQALYDGVSAYMAEHHLPYAITSCTDPAQALSTRSRFDMAFLDIQIGEQNGISVAEALREQNEKLILFFITNFDAYQDDAMDLQAFRFFTKPFSPERLRSGLDKAMEYLDGTQIDLYLSGSDLVRRMLVDDILYLTRSGRIVRLFSQDGPLDLRMRYDDVCAQLPQRFFYPVHKSFFVNVHYIQEYRYTAVTLTDGTRIPVAPRRQSEFHQYWFDYLKRR